MSDAWETTADDVLRVMAGCCKGISKKRADELFAHLDLEAIEDYALSETDPYKQCEMAYREIERQLIELGVIPAELLD